MATDTHHPRAKFKLSPHEWVLWFQEWLAHIKLFFIVAFERYRTRWLLHRSVVPVRRWGRLVWTSPMVFGLCLLMLILVAWGIRGILVLFFFRTNGWAWGSFNPDLACTGNGSMACGAVIGIVMPVLVWASATVLSLWALFWRVRRFYTRLARIEPTRLVQTSGSFMGEVVGRDQLADTLMDNLRGRKRRPHVLVGGGGVGKTAVLVRLTERLAAKGAIPVPIRLRDVQTGDELNFAELARRRFTEIVQPVLSSDAQVDKLWRWLRRREDCVVVLADGLEEALAGPDLAGERDNIIREAIRAAYEEALPIVIASRPHDPLRAMEAAITNLAPLSKEAALAYIFRGGSWRSDPMLLDRVVETGKLAEVPLYLQIARDLHRKDLLEPLFFETVSGEPARQDRWAFREDLLSAWLDALVEGKLHAELPIDPAEREAVVAFISALACIGLARDSTTVSVEDLDPSPATYRDGGDGGPRERQPGSRRRDWKAEWENRVARYLGKLILDLQESPAGQGDFWMDARVAATWATRMGLVQEAVLSPRDRGWGEKSGRGQGSGGKVHFQHSLIQAYLGSRFLSGVLEPGSSETASGEWAGQTGELVRSALLNSGRELRIALILHSRSFDGQCSCKDGGLRGGEPCPVVTVREQLEATASEFLHEAEARTSRLFRLAPGMPFAQFDVDRRRNLRRSALEILGTAVEIDSIDTNPQLDELVKAIRDNWPKFGLGEELVGLRETKLAVVEQCAAAARRVAADKGQQPVYRRLFEIACMEPSYEVRIAIARQIGTGGAQAYRELSGDLKNPENIMQGNGNAWPQDDGSGQRTRSRKKQAQPEGRFVGREIDRENRAWFTETMQAWLLPMLVESADATGYKDGPWEDLEKLINEATGVSSPSRGAEGGNEIFRHDGMNCARGLVLAQGFKFAANRRLTPWSNQEAREFLIKKAEELLKRSTFWYTRMTLVQALTLWALPDDVSSPQRIRGRGTDPRGKVQEWLRMDGSHKEHPLVKEAAGLAVRTLQTRRPERFLWVDDATVVSQIGTEVGAPGEPRLHNLWIPPSTGWSSLDFKAQQLLADVLLLLVLGERDSRPKDLFRLLARASTQHELPACLSKDRTRLDLARAVESDAQPGDYCRDDCELQMCPYPAKARNLRVEFNELFCLRQRSMLNTWQPKSWLYLHFRREAPRQRQVPVAGMRRFWDEMGERATDTIWRSR